MSKVTIYDGAMFHKVGTRVLTSSSMFELMYWHIVALVMFWAQSCEASPFDPSAPNGEKVHLWLAVDSISA